MCNGNRDRNHNLFTLWNGNGLTLNQWTKLETDNVDKSYDIKSKYKDRSLHSSNFEGKVLINQDVSMVIFFILWGRYCKKIFDEIEVLFTSIYKAWVSLGIVDATVAS